MRLRGVKGTFEALDALHTSLARILRELEGDAVTPQRLTRAIAAWQAALDVTNDVVGAWDRISGTVDPSEHPRLRSELERLRSLHALVTDAAMRGRSETGASLAQALVIRKAMRQHGAPGETGVSCDLSG